LASAKQKAAAAQALGREVKQTNDALAFFESRRNEVPPLRLLAELTKLVPLDSWLTELAVRGRNVEISGYAPRATDLIARVDGSAMFEKPQFRSAITLSPDDKGERFDLSFGIKPEPAR
jgi:general secretion pathway protein L